MMKKLRLLISLLGLFVLTQTVAFAADSCDDTFYGTLRYNKQYTFYDDFHANSSNKWMWDSRVDYQEQYDYNQSSSFPTFAWTDTIKNNNWLVPAGGTTRVLQATSAYPVLAVPAKRSYDNLFLKYTIEYSTDEAGKNKYLHTECKYYEISRCGDGTVDKNYDEICDPKDTTKSGWGNGGCSNSCKPITVDGPVCNSTYNGQRVANLTSGAVLCTKGTSNSFSYSETNHKWTWTCNNTAGEKVDCYAIKPYCGDGVKDNGEVCDDGANNGKAGYCNASCNGQTEFCGDGIKNNGEACDPKDTTKSGWGNGGCSNSCKPITVDAPVCSSTYNGQRVPNLTSGAVLCTKGTSNSFSYSETNHKWTWTCNNTAGEKVDCYAIKPYCGDGVKDNGEVCDDGANNGKAGYCNASCNGQTEFCGDGIKNNGEACDPKDTTKSGWGNGGCSNSCKPITVDGPVCNSTYNGQRVANLTSGAVLCTKGTSNSFSYSEANHKWTWTCNNTAGEKIDCYAIKPYCGDGVKDNGEVCDDGANNGKAGYCNASCNGQTEFCGDGIKNNGEACDPKDTTKSGWGNGGCSNLCQPVTVDAPVCNSTYNGQRVANLTSGAALCTKGTSNSFSYSETNHKWTWTCNNTAGEKVDCYAIKPYCGDGVKDNGEVCDDGANNGKAGYCNASCSAQTEYCGDGKKNNGEACDPKDTTKSGWGNAGCDNSCQPIITTDGECDEIFYGTLRYNKQYTFYDDFHANSSNKWLWDWTVDYQEQYDYNQSSSFPTFAWTDTIKNNNWLVSAGGTTRVIQATSAYPILAVPAVRSYNNFLIKYALTYSTDKAGTNKYRHLECKYYEISRCGDGTVDKDYDEICDPKDPSHTGWGNGGCSNSCKPITVDAPVCSSKYNGQRVPNLTSSSELCTKGTSNSFSYSEANHKWTWTCNNTAGEKVDCSATKPYCGDGIADNGESCDDGVNNGKAGYCNASCNGQTQYCGDGIVDKDNGEICDPKDPSHTGWGNGGCSNLCQPVTVDGPVCNSTYDGQRVANLTSGAALCTKGTPNSFSYSEVNHKWTWTCNNTAGEKIDCSAIKPYCGDGIADNGEVCDDGANNGKAGYCNASCSAQTEYCGDGKKNNGEACDPKDTTKSGWGNEGCDIDCQPINTYTGACDQTFYDVLRYNYEYTFSDTFNGKGTNRWLYAFSVKFDESADFNNGANPSFDWTDTIKNNNMMVGQNESLKVITATSDYHVVKLPTARKYNNLYIEYTIKYANEHYDTMPANSKLTTAKECVYYEVSRCGDGVLDTGYNEVCDPKDPSHTGWGDGGCDNSCQPITKPTGKIDVTKTLVSPEVVTATGQEVTWKIVTKAVSGNVTNFTIKDQLPSELSYKSFKVTHISSGLTVSSPSFSGNEVIWDVKGTLKEGDYIEMNLVTTVKIMPTQQVKNVVCVYSDDEHPMDPDDCDEDITHTPICSSQYNGKSVASLSTGDKLCESGTVSDFAFNPSANKWTWKCLNKAGSGVECSATKTYTPPSNPGNLHIDKTLTGKVEVESAGDFVTWSVKVWATSGSVSNFVITDYFDETYLGYRDSYVVYAPSSLTISTGKALTGTASGTVITWEANGTLGNSDSDYILIEVVTFAKKMPAHKDDIKNVACVAPKDNPNDKECDEEIVNPDLRIIKTFTDGTKTGKNVKIGDEIAYKISFGNSGNTSATITSIKDFLPKTVEYVSSSITINDVTYTQTGGTGNFFVDPMKKTIDGVYVDIFSGMTLKPGDTGYIILTGKVIGDDTNARTNWACIYRNDTNVDCDNAIHEYQELMCKKLDIEKTSFTYQGGTSVVTCYSSGTNSKIEIDCGNGEPLTGTGSYLSGTCTYPQNNGTSSVSYGVSCTVDGTSSSNCGGKVTVGVKDNPPSGGPRCEKLEIKTTSFSSAGGSTDVTCTASRSTSIKIDCGTGTDFGGHDRYINGNGVSLTGKCYYPSVSATTTYKPKCYIDGSTTSSACEGTVTSTYNNYSCFVAGTQVKMADGTYKAIEEIEVGDQLLGSEGVNTVQELFRPLLNQQTLWSINGSKAFVSESHPFMTTEGWKSMNPEASMQVVDEEVTLLEVGDILITENGYEEVVALAASCAPADTQLYNFRVDGDHTYYANDYLVHNKGGCGSHCHGGDEKAPSPDVMCFNTNTQNVSIEQGEVLPFFWNIEKLRSGFAYLDTGYTTIEGKRYSDAVDTYKSYQGACSKDQEEFVALNSLVCTFGIYDGTGTKVYGIVGPCLTDNEPAALKLGLIKSWIDHAETYLNGNEFYPTFDSMHFTKYTKYSFNTNISYIPNFGKVDGSKKTQNVGLYTVTRNFDKDLDIFGEYQIKLEKTEYLYCDGNNWTKAEPYTEVCANNFVLTNSYTVQKTPSGTINATTDNLSKYITFIEDANGKKMVYAPAYISSIMAEATTYAPNDAVKTAMTNFTNKYQKLAVKVDTNKFGNGVEIKKVPGKNIYFMSGNVKINGGKDGISTPFTIVQTHGNTTIHGSLEHNMMLLTKDGTITFEGDCNETQVVKGIYYTEKGLLRSGVKKNTLDNNQRCSLGNLHIKGVVIGAGLDNLMSNSRSNLNEWFDSNPRTIMTTRKNYIMNGASVLIEYSPSIFSRATMAPGAEDFTTALSIYKN